MSIMSEQKRKINETDPDYEDAVDQQAKRQRVLEQDGRQVACRKIHSIIKREFQKEISDKEKELQQIDLSLNEARLTMDRLRACIVASYYGRANQALSASLSVPSTSNCPSAKAPPPNIHPSVKKYIGKAPLGRSQSADSLSGETPEGQAQESEGPSMKNEDVATREIAKPQAKPSITTSTSSSPVPFTALRSTKSATVSNEYDDRRSRFKVKKKIVIGNVSRYIQVDQREPTDMSSHKWMVYVRGPKSQPDISGFVRKVWFFLHHSYKPNDHVEISCPPFHLTRRGWGEFPVRVQLHFVDPRNKKVDIIHHLKLDKTFTGLQTMGAETVVEVELERDFFEPEEKYVIPKESCLPQGINSIIPAAAMTTISSIRSSMALSSAALSTAAATSSSSSPPSPLQLASCVEVKSEEMMETSADVDMTFNVEDGAGKRPSDESNVNYYNVTIQHESVSLAESNISNMEEGETRTIKIENDIVCENKSRNGDCNIQCDVVSDEFNVTIDHENEKEKQGVSIGKENDKKENRSCLKSYSTNISSDVVIGLQAGEAEKENDEIAVDAEKASAFDSLPQPPPPSSLVEIPTGLSTFTQPIASNTNVISQKPVPLLASSLTVNEPSIASVVVEASQIPPPSDVGVAKQIKPVSLLTSFTLEKLRQQKQVQHQQHQHQQKITSLQPQQSNQQPRRKISTLNPGTAQQNISLPTSQPSGTIQTPTSGTVRKQFTVINLADLQKKKAPNLATPGPVIPQVATTVTNTAIVGNSHPVVLSRQTVLSQSESTGDGSATNHLVSSQLVVKDKGHIVQNPMLIGQKLVSTKPPEKQAYQVVTSIPNSLQKISLLSPSTNHFKTGSGATRMVYRNPVSSLSSYNAIPPLSSTSNVIRPSVPVSSKKQISLLTGLVIKSSSSQNKQTPDIQVVQNQTQPHSLTTSNSSSIISSPSIAGSVVVKTGGGSNQLNILSIPAVGEPNIASNIITPCSNTFLAQTASPRIMIAYPNNLKHTREENKRESEIKMSAIGKAKRNHGNVKSIIESMVSSSQSSSHDSEEERIRKQYQVLNAWKNNPLLFEDKGPQPLKRVVNYSDTIDGEVDVVPALNAEDYPDLVSLTQAALRLHPLIQLDVNKLTHPYCAESRSQWMSWPAGKQRAAEWHRACFTLRYLKACLGGAMSFKGVQLYKTRQLVEWCRLHAFSPQGPIYHKEEPSANPHGGEEDNGDPSLFPPVVNAIPQSFTKAKDLTSHLAGLTRTTNQVEEDVEILLDKPVQKKSYHMKTEGDHVLAGEDNSLLNGQPMTEGAFFIHDWMRKRGIKYSYQDVEGRNATNMVFQTMMEFASDVLRKSFSVCTQKGESTSNSQLSVQDVHTALSLLPGAAFCCNTYLGKEEEEEYREGEGTGPSR